MEKSANTVWQTTKVHREDREDLLGQKGCLLWFTGLSGSGKSTLATALEKELHDLGKLTYLLDGDNIRHGLNQDLGFSKEDRIENIRRIKEVSNLMVDAGLIVLGTFISPYASDRDAIRKKLGEDFVEIYVKCHVDTCKERDPKGLYAKVKEGKIKNFTGIDAPYEEPVSPDLIVETTDSDLGTSVSLIMNYLKASKRYQADQSKEGINDEDQ